MGTDWSSDLDSSEFSAEVGVASETVDTDLEEGYSTVGSTDALHVP